MKGFVWQFTIALLAGLTVFSNKAAGQSDLLEVGIWTFKSDDDSIWHNASLPANIFNDLIQNKLIQDPFYGNNEKNLKWIENKTWIYRCRFNQTNSKSLFNNPILELEEPDGDVEIWLNGKKIAETHNSFRTYSIPLKGLLQRHNELQLIFHPVWVRTKKEAEKYAFEWPEQQRIFTRKPQYQYGWDWGPRFISCGFRAAKIVNRKQISFEKPLIIQNHKADGKVELTAKLELNSQHNSTIYLQWFEEVNGSEILLKEEKLRIEKGIQFIEMNYNMNNPRLWWCNGMGKQNMYHFQFRLLNEQKKLLLTQPYRCGLRKIEWVQEKDGKGKSFYMKLNNVPVFMKGANFIPPHSFLSICKDSQYISWVQMAASTHMNMLRVWGGGSYYPESFYDAADENGILIWQDFMFACAMYPAHSNFVEETEKEVQQWVKKLRHHPSLALWCGNNEVDEAWKNWGWQKQYQYSYHDSVTIARADSQLFHALIPAIVSKEDPQSFYWPSSPANGWGRPQSLTEGDAHYWGVWWGMQPFEIYKEKTGRFMSEYGFQGMPSLKTFQGFMQSTSFPLDSAAYMNHQKHPTGYQTIQTYMERDYRIPTSFEGYAFVSQILQSEGMRIAMESHRDAMPYCMGTLFWQLNDCWPVSSWSYADFYGRPKALYYQVKRSYAPLLLHASIDSNQCVLSLVWDGTESSVTKNIRAEILNNKGNIILEKSYPLTLQRTGRYALDTLKITDTLATLVRLYAEQEDDIIESVSYLKKPKYMNLSPAHIDIKIISDDSIAVSSDAPVLNFWLEDAASDIHFENNNITLLPGKVYYFTCSKKHKPYHLKTLRYIYYNHENTHWQNAG